ncbi:MAG: macro domain-containing protein [Pseudonocardiaceae bacterium]
MRPGDSDLAVLIDELSRTVPELRARTAVTTRRQLYRVPCSECLIGVIPGSIRQVRDVDIWVNSENTDFQMARPTEFSVSAIIRYWGAFRDETGRIVEDVIADDLRARVGDRTPVAPGTAVVTGSGALRETHNVTKVIHVAAVQGEPGAGFRQVRNVEWCVTSTLAQAERIAGTGDARSVLFPMLGAGMAHADLASTASVMVTGVLDHLSRHRDTLLQRVFLLGYNEAERAALQSVLREATTALEVRPDPPSGE